MPDDDDLEAKGLIAHSYDSIWSIRKVIRRINDLDIPLRQGLSVSQIATFGATFIVSAIIFGTIIAPIMGLLGIDRHPLVSLTFLLGPPILATQRITKPMSYGKTIGGTMRSLARFHLDDRTHRRGLPIKPRRRPSDQSIAHWQREWVAATPLSSQTPGLELLSDPNTEGRFAGAVVTLQTWMDEQAAESRAYEAERREALRAHVEDQHDVRQGRLPSVYVPAHEDDSPALGTKEHRA